MRPLTPQPHPEGRALESHRRVPRSRFPAPPQSGVAREGDAADSSRRSRSQALAALATACLEHLAPARRRHTYAKAMRLAPVALLGLVRPLDGRLSETLIASGALLAPLSPTGFASRVYQGSRRPPLQRRVHNPCAPVLVRSLRLLPGPRIARLRRLQREREALLYVSPSPPATSGQAFIH